MQPALESEWDNLRNKEDFQCFHTSAAVSRNYKKEFAKWDDDKVGRVLDRIRTISKKYGIEGFSFAVNKADYDDDKVMHPELREMGGKYHYTWAIRHAVQFFFRWSDHREQLPLKFVFDNMDDKSQRLAKDEIETVMLQAELLNPGRVKGHYSFRNRCEVPALQCADVFAWTNYQFSCHKFLKTPLNKFAEEGFWDFEKSGKGKFYSVAQSREQLSDWSKREYADPRAIKRREQWKNGLTMDSIAPRPYTLPGE